jgi:CubicO group peptidase (beta-lactamase class C family)
MGIKMKIILIIATILIILVILNNSRQPKMPPQVSGIDALEGYIRELVVKGTPPGISIAVVKDQEIVYTNAFGFADLPNQMQATPDTVYHWWSITKIPTAIVILQLHEQGKLNLDDLVTDYLPFFQVQTGPEFDGSITIRQLLRHTAGLPDPMPAMIGWVHYEDEIYDQTELLLRVLPKYNRLKFTPDSKSGYSNLGYMVLGSIIEAASGVSYEDFIRQNILEPLNMHHTDFIYKPEMDAHEAAGSHPVFSAFTPLLPFLLDMKKMVRSREGATYWFNRLYVDMTPSSGLIGSVNDAAKLIKAYLSEDGLLSPASKQLMLPKGNHPTERPLGWSAYYMGDRPWVQHRGGGPGFATIMRIYPEEGLGMVIMANNTNLKAEQLVEALSNLTWK